MRDPSIIPRRLLLAALAGPGIARARPAHERAVPAGRAVPPLPLVVLDPGHGGKAPGALGVSGTVEKHVAYATATELRRQLLQGGRCRVELTREHDVFIPLQHRVTIAQGRAAALFVSMHADALADPDVRGASVYTLSDTASDAQTAALARRENSADRFGGPSFQNVSPAVANILASLVRQETKLGSAQMAHQVVHALQPEVGLLSNPSRHAGFMVLRAADIPSVLVEMGFMSNPQDEAALRRAEHRAAIAAALRRAIEAYLATNARTVHIAAV